MGSCRCLTPKPQEALWLYSGADGMSADNSQVIIHKASWWSNGWSKSCVKLRRGRIQEVSNTGTHIPASLKATSGIKVCRLLDAYDASGKRSLVWRNLFFSKFPYYLKTIGYKNKLWTFYWHNLKSQNLLCPKPFFFFVTSPKLSFQQ